MWKAPCVDTHKSIFNSRIGSFLFLMLFLENIYTQACSLSFFSYLFSRSAQHGNSYCYVNVGFERLGLASLSGAACPLCATSRAKCWITGWMAVKSRWAEPQANKRRRTQPRTLEGKVVCSCACTLTEQLIFGHSDLGNALRLIKSQSEPRARLV